MGTMFGATIAVMMYGAQAEETYIEKSMWFSPWVDQIKSAEFHQSFTLWPVVWFRSRPYIQHHLENGLYDVYCVYKQ